jgi:hypothetical protein
MQFLIHLIPVSSGFHSYTHAFRSLLCVLYTLPIVNDTSSKNAKLSSATTSFPWRDTNTSKNHGYNAVADDSCAVSRFVPRIRHPLPTKKVKKVEKVEHFRAIHTLWSLPDQGGEVCKVWLRSVQKCESVQTFSFIYKIRIACYMFRPPIVVTCREVIFEGI